MCCPSSENYPGLRARTHSVCLLRVLGCSQQAAMLTNGSFEPRKKQRIPSAFWGYRPIRVLPSPPPLVLWRVFKFVLRHAVDCHSGGSDLYFQRTTEENTDEHNSPNRVSNQRSQRTAKYHTRLCFGSHRYQFSLKTSYPIASYGSRRRQQFSMCNSSVSIVTSLWAGRPVFESRQGQGLFLFATASRPALRLTQSPI
jgi:hypothetical protein